MSHINLEQRYVISLMLKQGKMQKEIAEFIGKGKSVISREINRNSDKRNNTYSFDLAHRKSEKRKKDKPKRNGLSAEVLTNIHIRLKDDLSPEQIVGEAKVKGIPCVSHETIYKYI